MNTEKEHSKTQILFNFSMSEIANNHKELDSKEKIIDFLEEQRRILLTQEKERLKDLLHRQQAEG